MTRTRALLLSGLVVLAVALTARGTNAGHGGHEMDAS